MASDSSAWLVPEGGSTGQELHVDIATFPITHVAVFNDRAEVTRVVTFTPSNAGETSLVLSGLTEKADTETIRVNRVSGRCTILEVGFEVHHRVVPPDAEVASKRDGYQSEMKRLKALVAAKQTERARLQQTRAHVESYLQTLVKESKVTELEQMGKALDFYSERTTDVDAALAACDKEQADLEASLAAAKDNCKAAGESLKRTTEQSRDVTVQVDVIDPAEAVVLSVVYIVTHASWAPSYDIRVTSRDNDPAPTLSLTYFALVKHATDEDWKGCSMSLSTATPSKSGVAPTPARKMVRFRDGPVVSAPVPVAVNFTSNTARNCDMPQRGMMCDQALNMDMGQADMLGQRRMQLRQEARGPILSAPTPDGEPVPAPDQDACSTAVADTGAGNTSFVVERKVNIKSDNQPHKVTIAVLDLTPRFMYFTTPEQEEKVYMQVRVINSSSYKLLSSTKVAVFFNGSFVTTTQMRDTNPGEEINTFLGQDTSVKVEYKKLKVQHSQATGFMSSAQSTKYSFLTAVTNTKKVPVSVKVVGCVPRSHTDNIQVQLDTPKASEIVDEKDARGDNVTMQNAVTNNIVWVRKVDPGQKVELPLDYTVAWPKDRQIEITS